MLISTSAIHKFVKYYFVFPGDIYINLFLYISIYLWLKNDMLIVMYVVLYTQGVTSSLDMP